MGIILYLSNLVKYWRKLGGARSLVPNAVLGYNTLVVEKRLPLAEITKSVGHALRV